MHKKWTKFLGLVGIATLVGLAGSSPAQANCLGGGAIFHGFAGDFTACGDAAAYAFIWQHHRGLQRLTGGANATIANQGADTGGLSTSADGVFVTPGFTSGLPASYSVTYDWSTPGTDGCITLNNEGDNNCNTGGPPTPAPLDIAFAGYDAADPFQAKAIVVSLDFNEIFAAWIVDQAGAASIDGLACGYDGSAAFAPSPPCGLIPKPAITSLTGCDAAGCDFSVSVGAHSVPILDDCAVAESSALNCPRNLGGERQIVIKRGSCSAGPGDARTYIMAPGVPGTATPNFIPYSIEDLNLNGVLDAGEDGANGGVVNTQLDPLILAGNSPAVTSVRIPNIGGATDCAYLGVALTLDQNPDPTACGVPCESALTPLASVNAAPISLDGATVAPDRVINMQAAKKGGDVIASWMTTSESTTRGFNLIGERKNGKPVQLNDTEIPAKHPGELLGDSYSVAKTAKGVVRIFIERVKTDGSTERFGPAILE